MKARSLRDLTEPALQLLPSGLGEGVHRLRPAATPRSLTSRCKALLMQAPELGVEHALRAWPEPVKSPADVLRHLVPTPGAERELAEQRVGRWRQASGRRHHR